MRFAVSETLSPRGLSWLRVAGILLLTLLLLSSARAANRNWQGDTSSDWNTGGNWSGGSVPGSGDTATFFTVTAGDSLAPTITTSGTAVGISFSAGGSAFTIGGSGTLTIGSSGIANLSGNVQTFNVSTITLSAAQIWNAGTAAGGGLAFGGTTVNLGNNQTLTVDGSNNTTINNAITGTGTSGITKNGTGILTLGGSSANTYAGTSTVNDGRLELNKTATVNAFGGSLVIGNGTGAADSAEVRLTQNNQQMSTATAVTILSDGLFALNGNSQTVGTLAMTSGSITTGAGTLTLGGNVTGNANASSATVSGNLNLGGSTRTFTIADGTAADDMSVSAIISNGGLTKDGTGTLTLSGNNTFTGGVNVNNGTLKLNNAGALNSTTFNAVTLGGGTLSLNNNNVAIASLSGSSGTVNNTFGSGTATLTVNQSSTTTYTGTLADGGAGKLALTKTGSGTLTLNAANTYTGGTTLGNGKIALGADNALGGSASAFNFAGGVLDSQDNSFSIGALSLTADSTLNLGVGDTTADLRFNSATWTAGILTINNWSGTQGTSGSGDDNQIFITTAPDSAFLNHVQFQIGAELFFGVMSGDQLVAGVTPVPEPINVALGVFGVVFAGFGFARRLCARRAAVEG